MLLSLYKVVLPVSNIDKAEAFYSHLLGTPGRRVSPGQHHFDCGGMILNCYDPVADGDSSQVPPSPHKLYFVVEDLEGVFERAKSAGCPSLDEQIDKQPWGDRSFSAQDPFTNSLGFLDEPTAIQQLGQQSAAGPDDGLRIGTALSVQSIEGETERQAAAVLRIFSEEIWLQFSQPFDHPLFQQGEKVRIQYGNGSAYVFSDTEIVKIVPADNQYVAISIPEKAQALKRRAIPRIQSKVPISVSVLSSANGEVTSGTAFDSKTHDISTGGLRFDTTLPLEKGDELQLKLQLATSLEITLTAKVMGSKRVKMEGEAVTLVGTQFVEMHLDDQIKLLQFLMGEEEGGGPAAKAVKSPVEEPKVAAETVPAPVEEPKAAAEAV
ncbi:MAG: PilZ domain-containing protein, partial [Acidobacteriota bacterium]